MRAMLFEAIHRKHRIPPLRACGQCQEGVIGGVYARNPTAQSSISVPTLPRFSTFRETASQTPAAGIVKAIAERRCGELLRELERAPTSKGGDVKSASATEKPIPQSPYSQAIADAGLSYQRANRMEVPPMSYEARGDVFRRPVMPLPYRAAQAAWHRLSRRKLLRR